MDVRRTDIVLKPDYSRVLFRPFDPPGGERPLRIIGRIMALTEPEVEELLANVFAEFHGRHHRLHDFFLRRFDAVSRYLLTDLPLSNARKELIGSYFSQEYSLESAALFNPSIVWHPDQSDLPEGSRRFILSLRATGEGHVSSITFRGGIVDSAGAIRLIPPTRYVTQPETSPNAQYEKSLFHRKL
ncbi:MAG TPA: glycosidase, partial [Planctomycetia bacterium]|nr:glycosidase [Planctomycetia bacterium]